MLFFVFDFLLPCRLASLVNRLIASNDRGVYTLLTVNVTQVIKGPFAAVDTVAGVWFLCQTGSFKDQFLPRPISLSSTKNHRE